VFNISHYTTARITIEEENLRGSDNEDSMVGGGTADILRPSWQSP